MGSKDMAPLDSSFLRIFFKSQLGHKAQFPPKDTNLSGKVAIITGGNQGLGFESARQFLSFRLSQLIITARSEEKGKAAVLKLQAEYPKATIKMWNLDMCSYDSVPAFAKRVESDLPRLDIVILNAGRSKANFELVPGTGHEEMLQVNYLSTILLATLLLPSLKSKSPHGTPGRLSIVSSGTTLFTKFSNSQQSPLLKSFDNTTTAPAAGLEFYGATKVLCQMFLYKLVDYVSADDVVMNLVDPGMTKGTGLNRDIPKVIAVLATPMLSGLSRSVKDGASAYLDATVVKGKESHGCFVMDWEIRPFPSLMYTAHGKDTIERLWQETLNEFDFVDIRGILEAMKGN
ncbi:putative short-chain dehydrogenase/reductase family protein [Hyaloscypha variabilis F]|uniref:Putative short-chain dehydrogenase/reductase family protein n=1 Tax=Hyaloscypha variabilis (strain UAMH 11265 / GT02V1 / F) TaxID=1149755 RepID=A0A2J6RLB6_HYAVF|nr:putative short-chain dehydrogenase/reductase family protein [Hyaloscypha variabilis F]